MEPALPSTQVDPVLTKHFRCLASFQGVWVTLGECRVWVQASRMAQQHRICLQCRRCKRCGFKPWVGKIPWRRKCKPLQYSCPENSMDRGAWQAIVHGVPKSQTQLSDEHFTFSPGDLPELGIKSVSPALAGRFSTPSHQGSPYTRWVLPQRLWTFLWTISNPFTPLYFCSWCGHFNKQTKNV